jgi:PAS domain S-box-containing protein
VKNILIVDDRYENRYMIESLLKGNDFSFMSANNGIEALDIAHQTPPDLVISDILMPVMDGFTLCKEWRKDKLLKKIPFIFYTAAYTNPEDIRYALRLGADRVLIKPQESEEFMAEIRQVLHEFESGEINASQDSEKNELDSLREYNAILFRKLEDKLFQIELNERKLKRYSSELDQYIQDLKNAEDNVNRMHNLVNNLTEFLNIPSLLWDEEFRIQKVNRGFELFTGFKENETIGKSLAFLLAEEPFISKLRRKISEDNYDPVEATILTRKGLKKKAVWNLSSFINEERKKIISALILTDEMHSSGMFLQNNFVKNHLEEKIKNRTRELENSREQLRGLSSHLQNIREEERKHVAREIHDELGHLLTALKLDMEGLINGNNHPEENFKEKVLPLIDIIDAAIDSVKTIATDLRPAILDNFGLLPAMEWQIQQFRIRTKMECETEFDLQGYEFNNEDSTAIFRIFQEILTNISRHAKATKIWVAFKKEKETFQLIVKDNGSGFEVNKVSKIHSFGLLGMSERALSMGGQLTIESLKDIGTTVKLTIKGKNSQ